MREDKVNTENPVKDLYSSILNRLGNPITGTFIFAWLLTNWRIPIVIFFGSVPEQDKVSLLNGILSDPETGDLWHLLIVPSLVTIIYLFGVPLLKEKYSQWLNRSQYRTTRNHQRMLEDLREEAEYRETLRAICASLRKNLKEAQTTLAQISEYAKEGRSQSGTGAYSQIEKTASFQNNRLERTRKKIESFFTQYNGDLPEAYQYFFIKWKPKSNAVLGLWRPRDEEPLS